MSATLPPQARPTAGTHIAYRDAAAGEVALTTDYVVVGSGAGGAIAAITLARAGHRVCLVEAGAWRMPEDYPSSALGFMREMMVDWGSAVAMGRSLKPIVQARTMGGSCVINSAIVVRTPGDILHEWRDDHGLGDVFTDANMGAAMDAIESELQVEETNHARFGQTAQKMLDVMAGRQLEVHRIHRNVKGCRGVNQCLQGCRNGAKRSPNLQWIPELLERGQTVLSCAPVERVRIEGGRAVGVAGRFVHPSTRQRGARFVVSAARGVLLAASATGTAPLLQKSGYKHRALGHYWRGHPGAGTMAVYDEPMDMHQGPSQAVASIHHRRDIGIKLEHLSLPLELIAGRVSGAGRGLVRKLETARHTAMWVTAVRADAVGRVKAGPFGPVVSYKMTRKDMERLRAGTAMLARFHFEAGARRVRPGVVGLPAEIGPDEVGLLDDAPLDPRRWTCVVTHLFGGAVAGSDAKRSVVGADLHVRGVRGLHVVDAAVLPTTLGVNPQHTIMAVSKITAERLANSAA